jgi:hypothetical protein
MSSPEELNQPAKTISADPDANLREQLRNRVEEEVAADHLRSTDVSNTPNL